ncbi:MAG TPA: dodecin family protein [Burkholderiales bacterium]|jgi:flavin-binding protein dodecin|nr:dodecin family protein [Burkholderiales bacterium]
MAKRISSNSVYRITEIVGTSKTSWEDAARNAVQTASRSLRDLRVAEVTKTDLVIENGRITAFRARVSLSFKYEG